MENILSIHTGHDASIAYWKDYEQVAIYKEERLNRIKNWGRKFPILCFEEIKKHVNISDIDILLLSRDYFPAKYFRENLKRRAVKALNFVAGNKKQFISVNVALRLNKTKNENEVFDVKSFLKDHGFRGDCIVRFGDHHLAHALPTLFFNPGWSNALLYTSDGGGDGIQYSFTHFADEKLNEVYGYSDVLREDWMPDSMGQMYGLTTEICGFKKNRHEGKITGLAAFGDPAASDQLINMYKVREDARIVPLFDSYEDLRKALKRIYDNEGREALAASAQRTLETLTIQSIRALQRRYSFLNIGLSGGVCANVRLNQKIAELQGIEDVFIFPSMADEGLVVGRILDYLLDRDGLDAWLKRRRALTDMYWGDSFKLDPNEIPDELEVIEKQDIVTKTVKLLEANHICALFCKNMEYGPRALGARSILINPSEKNINNIVNKRLGRTEFMPFAPYVLEEMVEEIFVTTKANKKAMQFMTITTDVKEKWVDVIPATVHIDGTARPQTIRRSQNKLYYDILKAFYDKTGIPCLVNTSFNAHEEPIIRSPKEAFTALMDNRVDYLIFENGIIARK